MRFVRAVRLGLHGRLRTVAASQPEDPAILSTINFSDPALPLPTFLPALSFRGSVALPTAGRMA